MSDDQEQQIREQLERETDFWERQRLLKALWKMQQSPAASENRERPSHAA